MRLSFGSIKATRTLILLLPLAVISAVAFSCVAPSAGGGCGGPGAQGWSGFASYDGVLYFGSMDGKVLAVDPVARSEGLYFPSEREWVFSIRTQAPQGAPCGFGCMPAARPAAIYGTPAVTETLVYVGTYVGDEGKVFAINRPKPQYDEEGIPSWTEGEWFYPRGERGSIGAIVGSPIVHGDTVYVGDSQGKVHALDAVSGTRRWEYETGGKIWTSPAVKDGVVYIGNYEGKLHSLSSDDGSLLWEVELPAAIASSPVVSGNTVFLGTFDHYLRAIDGNSGREKWKFEGGNWFWAAPVVMGNVVYAGCLDHTIYALDARSGKELWQFVADSPIVSRPVLVNDLLVAISESGEMYAVQAASGVSQWNTSIGYSVMAPLHAEAGMVYVHTRNDEVCSIDVQNGRKAWEYLLVSD